MGASCFYHEDFIDAVLQEANRLGRMGLSGPQYELQHGSRTIR